MNIKWQEPPKAKQRAAYKYQEILDALMERPNTWGCVAEDQANRNVGDSLRQQPGVETTTRTNARGKIDIYARYVETSTIGVCTRCHKRGKINAAGLCMVHAPLGAAAS